MPSRIVVTPRSAHGHPAIERLRSAGFEVVFPSPGAVPTPEELIASLADSAGYLAGVEPVPRSVLIAAPRLRVISRNGTGADSIDLAAAEELGVRVLRAPAANAQGVAELTVALMLAAARSIPFASAAIARGEWGRREGIELAGRRLGIIGAGQVGRRVARVALALGMSVRAFDAFPDPSFAPDGDFAFAELDDVLSGAQVLSLHAPPARQPVVDDRALALMPRGAILVNTARATLVDERAVLDALDTGRLRTYATDVYQVEPPGMTPLTTHPSVIGTAHLGGFTRESIDRAMTAAVENLLDALDSDRERPGDD
ncbi:phosphoglycerate dehydrogenase [Herbiconiux sp. CPCC 203407]|uniref:Phosphoglycerate dehydrogenase n=1 Tax=Herbiconiux oxytropis TaxID=2970915 RepID=A0AA41XHE8_9MICO|nr:phosphoglycerate dehydrogenase [Herbiconiux oxytropis]MCS5723663.1 phosphoglycerate dehydrogenase [Herbiconiux oxytropis]MCS5728072.1 phosphoglycerate dehydrogenase [Herbiconiux oxytropis]